MIRRSILSLDLNFSAIPGLVTPLRQNLSFGFRQLQLRTILLILLLMHLGCSCAAAAPERIISLAPNMTELLFALGLGDRVVGVTTFCDYPEEARKKRKIGGMSNPSLEAVVSMKPDLVVMTTDGNPKEFEERLRSLKISTYVFRARRIREFPQGIRDMGAAVGARKRADELASEIEASVRKLETRNPKPETRKKKVLFIVWPEPLIVAGKGSIAADAMAILGVENIAADSKTAYPKFSVEEILRRAPDFIFFGRGKGMEEMSEGLLQRLRNVPAVKEGKVFYAGDYLYRLTPRTLAGLEEIGDYLEKP